MKRREQKADPLAHADGRAADLADLFRMLGDASRLRIVIACLDAPGSVTNIARQLGFTPSLVSHHLRLLRAARLVRADRHGREVHYSADDEHIRSAVAVMLEHVVEPRRRRTGRD